MKKKSRWILVVGLVLALTLALFPTQVMADPGTSVDPNGPYYPPAGAAMMTVDIQVTDVADLSSGQFKLLYDKTVITYLGCTCPVGPPMGTGFWPAFVSNPAAAADDSNPWGTQFVFYDQNAGGYDGSGTIVNIWFAVPGATCDSTVLDLTTESDWNELADSSGVEIACTWADGFLEVDGPCDAPKQHIVVSGQNTGGAVLPYAQWNDQGNDWGEWDPLVGPPPGFEECDEFKPCEWVWVWGYDFDFCQTYTIWIQGYEECTHVQDGDPLLIGNCPPVFPPDCTAPPPEPLPAGWEFGWVEVHIDEDGKFGPVPVWHVPHNEGLYCTLWEIVADKTDDAATNPGFYGCNEDGLDAACLGEWGFHIYPEGLTIILLSLGLVAVGGYLVVRRRRGAETDS